MTFLLISCFIMFGTFRLLNSQLKLINSKIILWRKCWHFVRLIDFFLTNSVEFHNQVFIKNFVEFGNIFSKFGLYLISTKSFNNKSVVFSCFQDWALLLRDSKSSGGGFSPKHWSAYLALSLICLRSIPMFLLKNQGKFRINLK